MSPSIAAVALKRAPQLLTKCSVFARGWHTRRLAVFNNLRQVDRHVAVYIEDFPIHDQSSEATNQTLFDGEFLQ